MTGSIVRLKDAEGNIINIPAFKGKDGVSPLLRKSDTAIEVSYDGGATYTELVPLSELKIYIYDGPGENDISLGLSNAAVGDIIRVKAVDDNGTPTAWESAAMPNNEENWVLLGEYDCSLEENQVHKISISKYMDMPFTATKFLILFENCTIKTGANCTGCFGTDKGKYTDFAGQAAMNTTIKFSTAAIAENENYQKVVIFEQYANGALIRSCSNQTPYAVNSLQGMFSAKQFFPASRLDIEIGGWQELNSGNIKVWAVIEQ